MKSAFESASAEVGRYRGLTESEVAASREANGRNLLEMPPGKPAWKLFLEKFRDPVIVILIVAALISMFTGAVIESIGILLAVLLATGIAFVNEYRAGKEFDILNRVDDSAPVKAVRNGEFTFVPKKDLVVGDVIFVETGEEVPADATVLESVNLHVDQSKFTGEPEPVEKCAAGNARFAELGEASYPHNLLLRGSTVLEGNAYAEVVCVGAKTEIGRTAVAASEVTDAVTPLQKQLNRLGKVIAICGASLAGFLLIVLIVRALLNGELPTEWSAYANRSVIGTLLSFFMIAITLIVVAVPEGLAMSVTLSLAYSMRRMTASQCLVRRLHACETIGAATVICTDKTGTLTMNQMRVRDLFLPSAKLSDGPEGALAAEAFSVNSTANLGTENGVLRVLGNPTEGALLIALHDQGLSYAQIRSAFRMIRQYPFRTEVKMMGTFGVSPVLSTPVLHVKGAPEFVLARCTSFRGEDGRILPLEQTGRERIEEQFRAAQSTGCRTLAFAYRTLKEEKDPGELVQVAEGLVYLGFVSIADPVRPEVPGAVAACRTAGIEVKIVTGDTPVTAGEIGRQIGLWTDGIDRKNGILEGREFAALSDEEARKRVKTLRLIARARPDDKMKLVKALQANGEVVAVTGDGTNDAPALNYADVGISMGRTGTAIAREASDIILLDDSFGTIEKAVLWGRSLYRNIQRFIQFQLTINVAAVGIALAGPFAGVELPLTVIQMLWINLIMDTFAALALATEPPDPTVMNLPPRSPRAFIVTPAMAWNIFGTAAFFLICVLGFLLCSRSAGTESAPETLTLLFTGFVLLQFWNLLNVRCFGSACSIFHSPGKNPVFWMIALGILVGQFLIVQFGGQVFRTVPLTALQWGVLLGGTSIVLWAGEGIRFLLRRFRR